MRHVAPVTRARIPALAIRGLGASECLTYLIETFDLQGFPECWQERKGCNCNQDPV